jgi:hypothetical protein
MNYKKGYQPSINTKLLPELGNEAVPERFRIIYTNSSNNSCHVWISCLIHIANNSIAMPQSKHFAGSSDSREIHKDLTTEYLLIQTDKKLELEKMRQMPVTVEVSCSYELFHLLGVTEGVTETYRFVWNQSLKTWAGKERISVKHHTTFGRRLFEGKNKK